MDLKPYYDAAIAADAEVKRIANEINDHFTAGENDQALELRPALDQAKEKANTANQLYTSMLNASDASDLPKLFVPANPDAPLPQKPGMPESKTRAEFESYSPHEKMAFMKAGGIILDQ